MPKRHGAGEGAGSPGPRWRVAGESARRLPPAEPLARAQSPGRQGHARGSARRGGAARGRARGRRRARGGRRSLTVTKHSAGARRRVGRAGDGATRLGRTGAGGVAPLRPAVREPARPAPREGLSSGNSPLPSSPQHLGPRARVASAECRFLKADGARKDERPLLFPQPFLSGPFGSCQWRRLLLEGRLAHHHFEGDVSQGLIRRPPDPWALTQIY